MTKLGDLIERHRAWVFAAMVFGPLLIGAYPITGLINPLWGSLFGFPLYLAAKGHPVYGPHPITEPLAFFGWPIVVIALMAWTARKVLTVRGPWRTGIVVVWLLSSMFVVSFDRVATLFPGWPVYCACE